MKVICAGLPKTGTKSMKAALEMLGYSVYDFVENTEILLNKWEAIASGHAGKESLKEMYENVDASMDIPFCGFWEEVLEAFPEAKVILTVRDSEEDFLQSVEYQKQNSRGSWGNLLNWLSPTYVRWMSVIQNTGEHAFPAIEDYSKRFHKRTNQLVVRQTYRKHNATVVQRCPRERLLIFNCKEGWKPMCEFLAVPVPDEAFPHKNVQGQFANEVLESKTFKRVRAEVVFSSLTLTAATGAAAIYVIYRTFAR